MWTRKTSGVDFQQQLSHWASKDHEFMANASAAASTAAYVAWEARLKTTMKERSLSMEDACAALCRDLDEFSMGVEQSSMAKNDVNIDDGVLLMSIFQ